MNGNTGFYHIRDDYIQATLAALKNWSAGSPLPDLRVPEEHLVRHIEHFAETREEAERKLLKNRPPPTNAFSKAKKARRGASSAGATEDDDESGDDSDETYQNLHEIIAGDDSDEMQDDDELYGAILEGGRTAWQHQKELEGFRF